MLSLGLSLSLGGATAARPVTGPVTGDALALTTSARGWDSDITFKGLLPGGVYNLDPSGTPKAVINLSSPGFNTSGNAVSRARDVILTASKRQASPNYTSPTEAANGGDAKVTLAQSDYIYDTDTITGASFLAGAYDTATTSALGAAACTNGSTLAYPKVIADWASVPRQMLGSGLDLEVVAFHRFGRMSLPVAAVKITATPTTGSPVTKLCSYVKSTAYGDQLGVWRANFTPSDFPSNGNADITFDFEAFPWFGNAASTRSTSGISFPSQSAVSGLKMRGGSITTRYAYVDNVSGNDGTATTSTTAATAAAAPYATINGALNAMFTASSNASNCVIRFKNTGTPYDWNGTALTAATRTAPDAWLILEGDPADSDPYNNISIQTSSVSYKSVFNNGAGTWSFLCFRNIGVTLAATFPGLIEMTFRGYLWFDHVKFVSNMTAGTTWLSRTYLLVSNSSGTSASNSALLFNAAGNGVQPQWMRGVSTNRQVRCPTVLSLTMDASGITSSCVNLGNTTSMRPDNCIMHNYKIYDWAGSGNCVNPTQNGTVIKDVAVVQGIATGNNNSFQNPFWNTGDHTAITIENIILDYISTTPVSPGTSSNILRVILHAHPLVSSFPTGPSDAVTEYKNVAMKRSNPGYWGCKDDEFSAGEGNTGAQYVIGGWPKKYAVGFEKNSTVSNQAGEEIRQFLPYFEGVDCRRGVAITYANVATKDFRPTANYQTIDDAEHQALTWDLNGVLRKTDGLGATGPLEIA